jgi:CheY-like chemotaxis protein
MSERAKILLVDDDVSFVESIKDLLEAYGYEVHAAHNGRDGFDAALRVRPDLMILDVMMASPTDGFQVARRVAETPELKAMKILLVTGMVSAMNLPAGLKPDPSWLPVDRVLEKPIHPSSLIAEVERVLGGTSRTEERR